MNFRIDQNDVVWFKHGFMSLEAYKVFRQYGIDTDRDISQMPPPDELPFWDSHNQNIVDVDD